MKDKIIKATGRAKTHQKYVTSSGEIVPGGSTIAKMVSFDSVDPLLGWAVNLANEGIDFRAYRKEAADFGSCFHAYVDYKAKGIPFPEENYIGAHVAPAKIMGENFFRKIDELGLEIVATEIQIVSDTNRWGGTLDSVLAKIGDNGRPSVLSDLKSSNGIYPEHKIQVGGVYAELFTIRYGYPPERVILFRAERNPPHVVEAHELTNDVLEAAYEVAKMARKTYDNKEILNPRRMRRA